MVARHIRSTCRHRRMMPRCPRQNGRRTAAAAASMRSGKYPPHGLHGRPAATTPRAPLSIISLAASGIQQNAAGSAIAHCRLFQRLEQRRIVTGIQKTLSGTHHDRIVSRILGVLAVCRQQVHIAAFAISKLCPWEQLQALPRCCMNEPHTGHFQTLMLFHLL